MVMSKIDGISLFIQQHHQRFIIACHHGSWDLASPLQNLIKQK